MTECVDTTESRWTGLHEVLAMAGPIILGSMSFTVMQFVDQAMVAQLGVEAIAALGPAGLWSYTLATFLLGIVSCVATFASQSLGRGEKKHCAEYGWQGIYLSLPAVMLALVLWPLAVPFFESMGQPPIATRYAIVYFQIRLVGYVFMVWQAALTAFFQAISRPRVPMYAGILANVLNLGLDYALIFGKWGFPRWGIAGAAVATVLSIAFQAAYLQVVFLSQRVDVEFGTRAAYAIDWEKIGELVRIGWGAGLQVFLDVANWAVFTSFVIGWCGATALAAHNIAINFMALSFMPALGLHHGIAPIVGMWIGRGNIPIAKARTYTAMKLAVSYMFLMGILMAVFGKVMIRLIFSQDAAVIQVGGTLLLCAAVFQAFDAINIVTSGALRGAGDTRWMAVVTVLAAYGGFLPLAYCFAYPMGGGAVGAWMGATVYIIGLSGILFYRFQGARWRHIKIFAKDRIAAAVIVTGAGPLPGIAPAQDVPTPKVDA